MNTCGKLEESPAQNSTGDPPHNWKATRLGDIVKFKSGKSRPKNMVSRADTKNCIPVYGGNGVLGYSDVASSEKKLIVIGRVGEYCGCVHIAQPPNWITDNALYSDKLLVADLDVDFLASYLSYLHLNRFQRKAGQPLITQGVLDELVIQLPPPAEQQAIAKVLGAIKNAANACRFEITLEQERKTTLIDYLFARGPRAEQTVETEIGMMPSNWTISLFKDVFTLTRKPKGIYYSDFARVAFVPMDLIPIGDVFFQEYILKRPDELTSGTYFEPGDLLVAKITPSFENGKQGIIQELPNGFGVATTEVIPIKGIPGITNVVFFYYYLLLGSVRSMLAGKMEGTTGRQRLNKLSVETMKLPLPPLDEQQEIVQILRACDTKITALENENKLLNELFDAMLEELMSGRLSTTPFLEVQTDE